MIPPWYSANADALVQESGKEALHPHAMHVRMAIATGDAADIQKKIDEIRGLLIASQMAVDALLGMYGTLHVSHNAMLRNLYDDIFRTRRVIGDLMERAGARMSQLSQHPALSGMGLLADSSRATTLSANFLDLPEENWKHTLAACIWALLSIRERVEAATVTSESGVESPSDRAEATI